MRYQNEDQTDLVDSDEEEKKGFQTVIEKPLPVPDRVKPIPTKGTATNFTLEPKVVNTESQDGDNDSTVIYSDKLSQLAIDYKLAMRNKQRIDSLMNLLGKDNGRLTNQQISELDINLGQSRD